MIRIVFIEPLPNYVLKVGFDNGLFKTFDLKSYMLENNRFQALLNSEQLYKQVKIDVGGYGISWNDKLDLSADGLYEHGSSIELTQKVFFTADLHFGHNNVIRFDNRPFSSVEEMDAELIKRWNNKVGKGDIVYVLGDFIWKSSTNTATALIRSLNGQIILIKGNHDRFLHNAAAKKALAGIKDYDDIHVRLNDGSVRRCILSHYFIPFYIGHRQTAIHLHGHSHNTEESVEERRIVEELKAKGYNLNVYNVGCMYWNYEPVTLDEILRK
ncbi:MAG: DUF2442 domain-containing protein [Christensenellaceae bacterium]